MEGTGRNYMLKKDEFGVTRFMPNDRLKSTTQIYRDFNSGAVDVLIINVIASTGASAQSSPEEGIDVRQRNMFVMQYELDINVEVQKRGRINRTGQLNNPVYTYIITQIPVELRKYLMFRKKLRKLDANVSADQSASAQQSELNDANGNPIEDLFNEYGFQVFKDDFIYLPENLDYLTIFENMTFRAKKVAGEADTAEKKETNINQFNQFTLELELYPVSFQEVFFDVMNVKYIQKKNDLLAKGEFQAELQVQNYRASLKDRLVIQFNSGKTVFSQPLFIADYFTIDGRKPLSKDKVLKKASDLANSKFMLNKETGLLISSQTPEEFYRKFKEDFLRESKLAVENYAKELEERIPKRKDFPNTEEGINNYGLAVAEKNSENIQRLDSYKKSVQELKEMINFFYPMRKISYQDHLGYFVGYKIENNPTRYKYTKGNVGFVFCCLSKFTLVTLKLTTQQIELESIVQQTNEVLRGDSLESKLKIDQIDNWKPDLFARTIKRFLSGNILSGIIEANNKKSNGRVDGWALTRFTNFDGSITTAIELKYDEAERRRIENKIDTLKASVLQLAVAADNDNIVGYFTELPFTDANLALKDLNIDPTKEINCFPIWNIEEQICERGICVLHKSGNEPYLQIQVIQSYKIKKEKDILGKETGVKIEEQYEEGNDKYNKLYHDEDIEAQYKRYLSKSVDKTEITYAALWVKREDAVQKLYQKLKVYVKTYTFLDRDVDALNGFLGELYSKYSVSFNFRSNIAEFYNVSGLADVESEELKKNKQQTLFPEGRYEYRFVKRVEDGLVNAIPNLLDRTFDSNYGGVVLSQPILPNLLPAYEMKPYKFPPDIYIKLTLAVLDDNEKASFARELEKKVEKENEDALEVGRFVRNFLEDKTVNTIFFFGDLRMSDFGNIFREYALKQDLNQIIIEEEEQVEVKKELKSKITTSDAERYIIELYKLI